MSEKRVFVDRWDDPVEISVPESSIVIQAEPRPEGFCRGLWPATDCGHS